MRWLVTFASTVEEMIGRQTSKQATCVAWNVAIVILIFVCTRLLEAMIGPAMRLGRHWWSRIQIIWLLCQLRWRRNGVAALLSCCAKPKTKGSEGSGPRRATSAPSTSTSAWPSGLSSSQTSLSTTGTRSTRASSSSCETKGSEPSSQLSNSSEKLADHASTRVTNLRKKRSALSSKVQTL